MRSAARSASPCWPRSQRAPASGDAPAALAHGIGDAFLAASGIAVVAGIVALIVLPAAATFLPKLRLAPRVAVH